MQLRSLDLVGFRRFRDATTVLEERAIAIVGRNEAGKSSLLEALRSMNNDEAIRPEALSGTSTDPNRDAIRLRFRLSAEERREVAEMSRGHKPAWLRVIKPASGQRRFYLDPPVPRERSAREAAAERLRKTFTPDVWSSLSTEGRPDLDAALADLESDSVRFGDHARNLLAYAMSIAESTEITSLKKNARSVIRTVVEAANAEDALPTNDEIVKRVVQKAPQFLDFTDEIRSLRTTYDITTDADNVALNNMLGAVGSNARRIFEAFQTGRSDEATNLIEDFHAAFEALLSRHWTQDERVEVRLQAMPGNRVDVQVRTDHGRFHGMDARSDGLRTYVALRAFLANQRTSVPPILLVDEAERHLHYDAQADLVRLFEQEKEVAGVIYTTHSVGCLPQDLGRGIRSVLPVAGTGESTIERAWTERDMGIMPLLVRMGAATAMLAPRRAIVIGEGPSEPALLPELIRQALGPETAIPFQVVGGLAVSSPDERRRMAENTEHMAVLLDGDKEGTAKRDDLLAQGFREDQVVNLDAGWEIEDLLVPAVYAEAVRSCLRDWGKTKEEFTEADIVTPGRVDATAAWCKARRITPPGHFDVVRDVLRLMDVHDGPDRLRILDPAAETQVRRVHADLISGLHLDDPGAGTD